MINAEKETICAEQAPFNFEFCKALFDPRLDTPDFVEETNDTPSTKRFNVYRNNVVVSLIEAMKAAYPSILAIMGEDNFTTVARIYVNQHPPSSPLMQKFGEHFPEFIAEFKQLKSSPFLEDVAKAERAWQIAFHASDHEPLSPEKLSTFPPEQTGEIIFTPHPATHLIQSDFPVIDLFEFRFEKPEQAPNLQTGQNLLITRPYLQTLIANLDNAQAIFVSAILRRQTLGQAIGEALTNDQNFQPNEAVSLLIQTGMTTHASIN